VLEGAELGQAGRQHLTEASQRCGRESPKPTAEKRLTKS
jgi:hypothetical protein